MSNKHFTDEFVEEIQKNDSISEQEKNIVLRNLAKLKDSKVNVLVTGATGCGKSSTINALFNTNKAKVGQGSNPETMDIAKYELDNIILHDTPGLGDGKEADIRHSKAIIDKLNELDGATKSPLIDLVLVILDGSSRDLGTSFELINQVIIPNLGNDKNRLLIAINQADMAMKGRYWDYLHNKPEAKLVEFLNEKIESTKKRIKEATGVDVEPIYYCAGYKDGDAVQNPYNLSKLFAYMLRHTKIEKRALYIQDINKQEEMWKDDEDLKKHQAEIKKSVMDSVIESASNGADIGGNIGAIFGKGGEVVGKVIGAVCGGVVGFFKGLFG